ncbi:uncharacterized protein [Procambarus clarkii]|uniref:uncharacterized protein isoform X3 n=1 Tax=Procambarus clarkii TaxID=6728 RepID=UPI001E677DA3|nr:uncharacterized protein LOC123768127 isoform X2 [Procambarus clarkii]
MTVDTSEVVTLLRKGDKVGVLVYLRNGGDPNARNHLGWTLLHLACVEGQTEVVEVLLDAGASVNSCTTDSCTPLHRASAQGYSAVVELLLKKNAYVNAQDKAGNTPLHEAARGLHTAVAKLLIGKKADMAKTNRKNQGFLQLVGQQLMPVVESGDCEVLVQWLDWGLSPDTKGNLHWSILHHAAARGQLNIVSLLIERGANINAEDSNRTTPLHTASFHGHLRVVDLLADAGANLNAADQRGNTPLHSAIEGGHPHVISLLLQKGCDTSIPNKEGQIFTHLVNEFLVNAVHSANAGQVTSLLKGQADPNSLDSFGFPVLCHAAFKGDVLITDALLEGGANPNLTDAGGKTPLHHAAYWGHLFVLKALLDKGATVNVQDKNGSTPLHEAAREGAEDVITVLVGRGAKLNAADDQGNTPLHAAARWGQTAAVELLMEKGAVDTVKNKSGLLYSDLALIRAVRTEDRTQVMAGLAWGGDPNSRDPRGWTLLHHAVYKGTLDICFLLLECGANVNAVDSHGRTPLLLAAYRGNHQIMQVLLDEGSDINAQDWMGQTPLHWAASEGSVDTVHLLLERGADTSVRSKDGLLYTDMLLKHLYLAVRHNDADKVVGLVRAGADQFAEVEGTGLNPREEAKRQGLYDILRQMAALAKKEPRPEDDKIVALEDVYRLFEDGYITEDADSSSAVEGRSETIEDEEETDDTEEDAYWKMSNAYEVLTVEEAFKDEDDWLEAWMEKPKVISAKELFEEDHAAFWENWEEKPEVVSAKEFFKEDSNWWEDQSDKENLGRADEKENNPQYISAKEFFRDDECWWRDAVEDLDTSQGVSADECEGAEGMPKKISAKDYFKDEKPWWETEEEEKKNVISAKEFFKDEDKPWWETEEFTEQEKSKGFWSELKKSSDTAHLFNCYSSVSEEEEDEVTASRDEEDEEEDESSISESNEDEMESSSRTDDFEDANDSLLSDTSTMYSVSEGERLQASVVFRDTPWWEADSQLDQTSPRESQATMPCVSQEKQWQDDLSEASEATETLDMDTSEISEAATTTEFFHSTSQNPQIEPEFMTGVEKSKRSIMEKMRTEIDVEEDADDEIDSDEDEERETDEGDKGLGEEYNSECDEIKSEDEIEDILDEELGVEESESENDGNEEDSDNIPSRTNSPSPGIEVSGIANITAVSDERKKNIMPSVEIDMYDQESDTTKSRTCTRDGETEPVEKTTFNLLADSVSNAECLAKEDTNIIVDITNTLLDPNQLSVDSHYMEGNLQKSDSQTSGYESSLSLSETKIKECKVSVVHECSEDSAVKRDECKSTEPSYDARAATGVNDLLEREDSEPLTVESVTVTTHDDEVNNLQIDAEINNEGNAEDINTTQGKSDDVERIVIHMELDTGDITVDASETKEEIVQKLQCKLSEEERKESNVENIIYAHSTNMKLVKPKPTAAATLSNSSALKENLGDKTAVNKMDDCLAKVDASLAWVDARLTEDSGSRTVKGRSVEHICGKQQAEDARPFAVVPTRGGGAPAGVTPKYCGVGKITKSQGRVDSPAPRTKSRTTEKDSVLLMKVHVHVPEESSNLRPVEEGAVVIHHGTISQHITPTDSKITGGTFLGVVNTANSESKKSSKYVSRLSEGIDLEDTDLNTPSLKPNHQILASKAYMETEAVTDKQKKSDPATTQELLSCVRTSAKEINTQTGEEIPSRKVFDEGISSPATEEERGQDEGSVPCTSPTTVASTNGDEDKCEAHVNSVTQEDHHLADEQEDHHLADEQEDHHLADEQEDHHLADEQEDHHLADEQEDHHLADEQEDHHLADEQEDHHLADEQEDHHLADEQEDHHLADEQDDHHLADEQEDHHLADEQEDHHLADEQEDHHLADEQEDHHLADEQDDHHLADEQEDHHLADEQDDHHLADEQEDHHLADEQEDHHVADEQEDHHLADEQEDHHVADEQEDQNGPNVPTSDDRNIRMNVMNQQKTELSHESSPERPTATGASEVPRRPPRETVWRCSTYEAMSLSDYDNLAFLIRKSASSPACWIAKKTLSIESLDKARDDPSEEASLKCTATGQRRAPSDEASSKYINTGQRHFPSEEASSESTTSNKHVPSEETSPQCTTDLKHIPSEEYSTTGQNQGHLSETLFKVDGGQNYGSVTEEPLTQLSESDDVKATRPSAAKTPSSRCHVDRYANIESRHHVEQASRSRCYSRRANINSHEQTERQSETPCDRDSVIKKIPQTSVACEATVSSAAPPTPVAAQACSNSSESSTAPDPLLIPPRRRERKMQNQTVNDKDDGHSANSKSTTNAPKTPTNTTLLYDPDKKEDRKIAEASQIAPGALQVHQAPAISSKDPKKDQNKTKELCAVAGKSDPVRKSSSCHIS